MFIQMHNPSQLNRLNEANKFLQSIQIAIYGYYDPLNRLELRKFKQFFIDNNFNAKLAEDFQNPHLPTSYEGDAITCSEMLYDSSIIHLYVITPPFEDQRNRLLDSLSMEYGWAWKDKRRYVGVYFKENFDISTLPLGALHTMHDEWSNAEFEQIEDIFSVSQTYCEIALREIYRLSNYR